MAIAKACGWDWDENSVWSPTGGRSRNRSAMADEPDGVSLLPDYLSDLNAMHEAEKLITDWRRYSDRLMRIVRVADIALYNDSVGARYRTAGATAAQKAEALLRYLGLWKTDETDVRPNNDSTTGVR